MTDSDEAIYAEHAPALLRFAAVLVGPDDAADVLSVVMVRVLTSRRLADLRDPRAYLMRAVANEARNHRRSRARRSAAVARLEMSSRHGFTEESFYPEVTLELLRLPIRQRAAVYLVYWVGHDATRAGEILGIRPGTVRRYLKLARDRLRAALGEGNEREDIPQ